MSKMCTTESYSDAKQWNQLPSTLSWHTKECVNLGWMVIMCQKIDAKISQQIKPGWKAFTMIKDVLKVKLDKTLCENLFSSTILLAMLHTSKTWTMTRKNKTSYSAVLLEYVWSEVIWKLSGVKNMIVDYCKQKFRWTRHVTRFTDNSWICAVVKWDQRDCKPLRRSLGWWEDEIVKQFWPTWRRRVRARMKWKCIVAKNVEKSDDLANKGIRE